MEALLGILDGLPPAKGVGQNDPEGAQDTEHTISLAFQGQQHPARHGEVEEGQRQQDLPAEAHELVGPEAGQRAAGQDEQGDEGEKQKYFAKLNEMISEMPKSFQVGMFILVMGMDESGRRNYETAKKLFEDGLAFFKGIRNLNFQLVMKSELGHIERRTGNLPQARLIYQETIKGWQELGNRNAVATQLECFGLQAIAEEEPQRATKLFSVAQALRQRIDSPMTDYERVEYDESLAQLRAMLTETEFNALWAESRAMTMEQAIELASH